MLKSLTRESADVQRRIEGDSGDGNDKCMKLSLPVDTFHSKVMYVDLSVLISVSTDDDDELQLKSLNTFLMLLKL